MFSDFILNFNLRLIVKSDTNFDIIRNKYIHTIDIYTGTLKLGHVQFESKVEA